MEYRPLGNTDLKVSSLCLGTMTWGNQNSAEEGFAQMDLALDRGINFFDTAEMYAVPASAETSGRTEEIIGQWFASMELLGRSLVITARGRSLHQWEQHADLRERMLDVEV